MVAHNGLAPFKIALAGNRLGSSAYVRGADSGTRTHTVSYQQILSLPRLPFRHIRLLALAVRIPLTSVALSRTYNPIKF